MRQSNICFKIDFSKAYDRVSWAFLKNALIDLGFSLPWVDRVMTCVSSASFAVLIDGAPGDFHPMRRGLRQGDPMSPYLFLVVMEELSKNLEYKCWNGYLNPPYIPRVGACPSLLTFADDFIIFSRGDHRSYNEVMHALEALKLSSSLSINPHKSQAISFGEQRAPLSFISNSDWLQGSLPLTYLGVPLFVGNMQDNLCVSLILRVEKKLSLWSSKLLSYAGRLCLIRYVLFSLIGYWCSVFILPKSIQHKLEATMANFLWGSQETKKGVHLVAWKTLCRPVLEGGVRLKLLADWNKACIGCITLHICQDEAPWASFIRKKYLALHSLWALKCPKKESWFFKGVRKSWVHILHQVRWSVGIGAIRFWTDKWGSSPLIVHLNHLERSAFDFSMKFSIKQVIDSDLPILHNFKEFLSRVRMERPNLHSQKDLLLWQNTPASNIKTTDVWEVVRQKYDEEPWRKLIWFPNTQPRAQWFVWLACNDRLPTFDRQKKSDISLANRCALCLKEEESAHHIMVCVDGFYAIVRNTGEDKRDLQVWLNTGIVPDKCPRIVTGQACLQVASVVSNGRQLVVFMLKDSDGLHRDQGVAWRREIGVREIGFPLWRHDLSNFSSIAPANLSSRMVVSEELPRRKTPLYRLGHATLRPFDLPPEAFSAWAKGLQKYRGFSTTINGKSGFSVNRLVSSLEREIEGTQSRMAKAIQETGTSLRLGVGPARPGMGRVCARKIPARVVPIRHMELALKASKQRLVTCQPLYDPTKSNLLGICFERLRMVSVHAPIGAIPEFDLSSSQWAALFAVARQEWKTQISYTWFTGPVVKKRYAEWKNLAQPLKSLIRSAPIRIYAELIEQANSIEERIEEGDFDGIIVPKYKEDNFINKVLQIGDDSIPEVLRNLFPDHGKVAIATINIGGEDESSDDSSAEDPCYLGDVLPLEERMVNRVTVPHVLNDEGSGLNICPNLTAKALGFYEDKYRFDTIKIYRYNGRGWNNKGHPLGEEEAVPSSLVKDEVFSHPPVSSCFSFSSKGSSDVVEVLDVGIGFED
ncbi:putative ribonuclease H protein [Nymphaea thermarum]|nr:putative ribonuclease H protein [Nymphaea thermarum]